MRLVLSWLALSGAAMAQSLPPLSGPPSGPPSAPAPDVWVPRTEARLSVLEKVRAQASAVSVKAGGSATVGSLTMAVKSCVVRPPDQPGDAAAAVDITDSRPGAPGFHGWLLMNEPYASMLQSPIYDVRLLGCK